MTQLIELLKQLERDCFFGSVTIQYRAGDVELVRKEQTIKLGRNNPHANPAR